MNFKINDFSDIGTVVLYKSRKFYPTLSEEQVEELLEESQSDIFSYSTSEITEYIDFAKYGLNFDPPETDYKGRMLSNLYDYQETKNILGENFDTLISGFFPQLSDITEQEKKFFGKLQVSGNTVYLIKVPKDIWKIEVYNSRISCNNAETFIEYDVLERLFGEDELREKKIPAPVMTIYFGPEYSVKIEDVDFDSLSPNPVNNDPGFLLYLNRYVGLTEGEYNGFKTYMGRSEYVRSYREEIESEKLLYIVNSSDGELKTINFFSAAYPLSDNKHPHKSEITLRNDVLKNTRHTIFESPYPGVTWDSRNKVLLGNKETTRLGASWFWGALDGGNLYSRSARVSSNGVKINGKIYKKASKSDVFGEDPVISPWWYSEKDIPKSDFQYYYITKTGKGDISPGGLIYIKGDRPLSFTVKPSVGYEYGGIRNAFTTDITEDSSRITINQERYKKGYRFEVVFNEIIYTLELNIWCIRDYVRNNGQRGGYNLFNEIGTNKPLSNTNIRLFYLKNGEETEFQRGCPIEIHDTNKLYFRFDTSSSEYYFPEDVTYQDKDNSKVEKSGEYLVIDISKVPSSSIITLGDNKYIMLCGEIVCKKYTVLIQSAPGVQISTPKKNILEYGQQFETKMILGDKTVEVFSNGKYESSGNWELIDEGDYTVFKSKAVGIRQNYEIVIK